jgi:carbamoyl-phosphate synthase large subunit
MPLDPSLRKVLVIGSGPIVIAQAAEFDYSGTQACQALRQEGLSVVLCNSNPATIMTDPVSADAVYLEPLTCDFLSRVLRKERPQGILPTMGGQTGLNLALQLAETGVLREEGVAILGTPLDAIRRGEDRALFRALMYELNEPVPESATVQTIEQALSFARTIGYPVVVRPAFTLGGSGGGFARDEAELAEVLHQGLRLSPIHQCLIERSIAGYKEIEYEVLCDHADNAVVVCGMENVDPVGVHTGDSIVVAPIQTLTDRQHQMLRSASLRIVRALGIRGGCNVQLALDPHSDHYYVIEVNPRLSRSSALASKATGYPIARLAALIAIGYTLDELRNPITGTSSALFEPTLDYVVCKLPRWPFDKFLTADRRLGTQMKSTGEVMALGRSLEEALLKAVRSWELSTVDHVELPALCTLPDQALKELLCVPTDERLFALAEALRRGPAAGFSVPELARLTQIDAFFLQKLFRIVLTEQALSGLPHDAPIPENLLRRAKQQGFADSAIARHSKRSGDAVTARREALGLRAVYKKVDTCAAEFPSETPYFYSTYENHPASGVKEEDEAAQTGNGKPRVVVLGSGPIRIGQGIEFDWSCVHAVDTLRACGYEAILINNNPETVSTDAQRSDRLYFEPLDTEAVLRVLQGERPLGMLVQFGGQTALNLAYKLRAFDLPIFGTALADIDRAEDRFQFEALLEELGIPRPPGAAVSSLADGMKAASRLGFPLLLRPSYVLGGRAMRIVYAEEDLQIYLSQALRACPDQPVLLDRYLMGTEVEVDALCDGENVHIAGILEHIEQAGVHSGDSIAVYPPQSLSPDAIADIIRYTTMLGRSLRVRGLFNLQFVLFEGRTLVLEVNPRSSRTVPFLSKVTRLSFAAMATRLALGETLAGVGLCPGAGPAPVNRIAVKVPVFSFAKLRGADAALGPEMKSTGEVIGQDVTVEKALYKGLIAAGIHVPLVGGALITVDDEDKPQALVLSRELSALGFRLYATAGTERFLRKNGIAVTLVGKLQDSARDILDLIERRALHLVINTPTRRSGARRDGHAIRRTAVENGIPCLTSLATAFALIRVIAAHSFSIEQLPSAFGEDAKAAPSLPAPLHG